MKTFLALVLSLTLYACSPAQLTIQTKWLTDSKGKKLKTASVTETDSKGNILKSTEWNETGSICWAFSYEYQNGRLAKKSRKGCDAGQLTYTLYLYDKQDRVVQENEYDEKQKLQTSKVNSYAGSSKNITSSECFSGVEKQSFLQSTFEYDANNLVKKEVQTSGGAWFQTNNYKYDSNKHLIYEDAEADGGVGVVKYYYIYKNGVLVKDVVHVPDTGIEYHTYETTLSK